MEPQACRERSWSFCGVEEANSGEFANQSSRYVCTVMGPGYCPNIGSKIASALEDTGNNRIQNGRQKFVS